VSVKSKSTSSSLHAWAYCCQFDEGLLAHAPSDECT